MQALTYRSLRALQFVAMSRPVLGRPPNHSLNMRSPPPGSFESASHKRSTIPLGPPPGSSHLLSSLDVRGIAPLPPQ